MIPSPVVAVAAEVLAQAYTWTELAGLFMEAGAPGESPQASNKRARAMEWMRRINHEMPSDALTVLGRLLHRFMEEVMPGEEGWVADLSGFAPHPAENRNKLRDRMRMALASAGLAYGSGGHVTRGGMHIGARQLHDLIAGRDLPAIEAEFETLAHRAATHPRDALSAAANIVEAVLGELVAAWRLTPPAKRTLNTLWSTVKPALNLDPAKMGDPDLVKIAGAMAAMVDGLQGLRDDKSRAHAMRAELARAYRIEPRHARLAVNAALALTVFLVEAWHATDARKVSAS